MGKASNTLRDDFRRHLFGDKSFDHVTAVELAPDGRSARVAVAVDGDDREAERSIKGLTAAVGYLRREVAERLQLRRAPELFFWLDRAEETQARVEELLKRSSRKKKH